MISDFYFCEMPAAQLEICRNPLSASSAETQKCQFSGQRKSYNTYRAAKSSPVTNVLHNFLPIFSMNSNVKIKESRRMIFSYEKSKYN